MLQARELWDIIGASTKSMDGYTAGTPRPARIANEIGLVHKIFVSSDCEDSFHRAMLREASKLLRHSMGSATDPAAIAFRPENSSAFSTRDLEEVTAHATPKSGKGKQGHRARPSEERPAPILERMGHIALRQSTGVTTNDKKDSTSPGKEGVDPENSPLSPEVAEPRLPKQVVASLSPLIEEHKSHHKEDGHKHHKKDKKEGDDKEEAQDQPSSLIGDEPSKEPKKKHSSEDDSDKKKSSEHEHDKKKSSKDDSDKKKDKKEGDDENEAKEDQPSMLIGPTSDSDKKKPSEDYPEKKKPSEADSDKKKDDEEGKKSSHKDDSKDKPTTKGTEGGHVKQHTNPYKALSTGGLTRQARPESKIGALSRKAQSVRLPSERTSRTFRSSRDATNFSLLLDVCRKYPSKDLHGTVEALLGSSAEFKTEQAEETIEFEVLTDRNCDLLRVRSMRSRRCSFSFGPHYLLATGVRSTTTWIAHSTWRKSYPFSDHTVMAAELEKCESLLGEAQLDYAKQYLPGKMSEGLAKLHLQTPSGSPVFRVPSSKKDSHTGRANRLMMETAFRLCKQPLRDAITAFDLESALKRASVIDSSASSRRLFDIASSLDADSTGFLEYNEFYLFCHYITAIQVRKMTILSCPGYLLLGSTWTPVVVDLDLYSLVLSIYANPAHFKLSPLERSEIPRHQKHSGHKTSPTDHQHRSQLKGLEKQGPRAASANLAKNNKKSQHTSYHQDKKMEDMDLRRGDDAAEQEKEKHEKRNGDNEKDPKKHSKKDKDGKKKEKSKKSKHDDEKSETEDEKEDDPIATATGTSHSTAQQMLQKMEEDTQQKPMTAYERSHHDKLKEEVKKAADAEKDFLPDTSNIADPNRAAQSSKVPHEQQEDDPSRTESEQASQKNTDSQSTQKHGDHHHHNEHKQGGGNPIGSKTSAANRSNNTDHRIWDIRKAAAFDRDEIEHRVVFTLELHDSDGSHELSMVVGDSDVADFGDGLRFLMSCWEYQKADREHVEDLLLGQLARTAVHCFFTV